jgi:hypothetical protein
LFEDPAKMGLVRKTAIQRDLAQRRSFFTQSFAGVFVGMPGDFGIRKINRF